MKQLYKEFDGLYRENNGSDAFQLEGNCRLNYYYQTGLITLSQADAISKAFGLDYVYVG